MNGYRQSEMAQTGGGPQMDTGKIPPRLNHLALYRWWRHRVVGPVDHEAVVARIVEDSGWSPRYAFMTMMSAGIAVLGLLLSSPAVVIGAMLISPLMSPILGFGFSLALFDFAEMRRSLFALMAGSAAAVAFTALIVTLSPLQAPTAEIVARTRPNLFDLGVALFAALAGSFAILLIELEVVTIPGDLRLVVLGVAAIPLALGARALSVLLPLRAIRPTHRYGLIAPVTLIWGGLRGGISIALALGLPDGPARSVILAATYVVVLFSVIVQGGTIKRVLERLTPAAAETDA